MSLQSHGNHKGTFGVGQKPPLLTHIVEPDGDVVVDGVEGGDDHGQQDLGTEPQELGVALGAILK